MKIYEGFMAMHRRVDYFVAYNGIYIIIQYVLW